MAGNKTRKAIFSSKKFFFLLLLLPGLLGTLFILAISAPEKSPPPKIQEAPPLPPPPPVRVISGKIAKGQTLSSALRSQHLSPDLIAAICRHLGSVVNLRQVKPGDTFEVRLSLAGNFLGFFYRPSPIDIFHVTISPSGAWVVQKKEVAVEKYWTRVAGKITSSLFAAMDGLGEHDQLVLDFAEIFSWEIDFNSEPQPGDQFQMVVEKYFAEGAFVKYGRILYAEYQTTSKRILAFYYHPPGEPGDYYTAQGDSLRKAFLRSPLKFTRISSGYSKSRRHPILGGHRPHYGIDYAAPVGSPVWAIADGTVTFCGWNAGYGKQVVIKHAKGYQSMYGHLSRFASGIKPGKLVRQKQIIGYVGTTGLSTGPHLDFRLLKNQTFRNPLREISPRAAPLQKDQIPAFKEVIDPLLRWVQDPSNPRYRKEASLTSKDLEGVKGKGHRLEEQTQGK